MADIHKLERIIEDSNLCLEDKAKFFKKIGNKKKTIKFAKDAVENYIKSDVSSCFGSTYGLLRFAEKHSVPKKERRILAERLIDELGKGIDYRAALSVTRLYFPEMPTEELEKDSIKQSINYGKIWDYPEDGTLYIHGACPPSAEDPFGKSHMKKELNEAIKHVKIKDNKRITQIIKEVYNELMKNSIPLPYCKDGFTTVHPSSDDYDNAIKAALLARWFNLGKTYIKKAVKNALYFYTHQKLAGNDEKTLKISDEFSLPFPDRKKIALKIAKGLIGSGQDDCYKETRDYIIKYDLDRQKILKFTNQVYFDYIKCGNYYRALGLRKNFEINDEKLSINELEKLVELTKF